ncbi:hypothetical protein J6590_048278 [Homalodisca vitripennis]|nr:hypothetical protein J6590_048278 [Homalodisca vitripennis]
MVIDSSLTWQQYIRLSITKLNKAFCANLTITNAEDFATLKQVYAQFHISYEVNVWSNSSESIKIFWIQRRIIRLIIGAAYNDSCFAEVTVQFSCLRLVLHMERNGVYHTANKNGNGAFMWLAVIHLESVPQETGGHRDVKRRLL